MTDELPTLPDYLRPGLDLVFVGINPGAYSASVGKYFATPRNRFWAALNRSGLAGVERELGPGDEAWLVERGIGFTDVVKRPSRSASELSAADFRRWAPVARERLLEAAPLIVCFNGLTACKWFMQYTEAFAARSSSGSSRRCSAPAACSSRRAPARPTRRIRWRTSPDGTSASAACETG